MGPKSVVFLAVIFAFLGCSKAEPKNTIDFESEAVISGEDFALCPCCGGWFITIAGETTTYRFDQLPSNSTINLATATLPLSVKLNWSLLASPCSNMPKILIENIALN